MRRVVACCLAATMMLASIGFKGGGHGTLLARTLQVRSDDLDVVEVRPDFYMIAGAGANIAVQVGPAGVILVDTGTTQMSDRVLTAVQRLTNRRIRYIINTSGDADHVGGNEKLSRAGQTILGNPGSSGFSEDVYTNGSAASVLAHENVL